MLDLWRKKKVNKIFALSENFSIFNGVPTAVYHAVQKVEEVTTAVNQTVARWAKRVDDRHALSRMDSRLLRDIGLTRGEVEIEINKPFWR